jgi:hypothetical protein
MIFDLKTSVQGKGVAMKWFILTSVLVMILVPASTGSAQETTHTGTIVTYHLDGDVPGRGPCVQTEPPVSGGWICLYRPNPLHEEFREALRAAFQFRSECVFGWQTVDAQGFPSLTLLTCARR